MVGHVKTVIILAGGCLFFGDDMPLKKLAGINVAMFGIIWYTQVSHVPYLSPSCDTGSSPGVRRCVCVQLKLKAAAAGPPSPLQQKTLSSAEEGQEAQPLKLSLKTRSFSRDLTMSSDLASEDLGIAVPPLPRPGLPSPLRVPRK